MFASAWPADADRIATLSRRIERYALFGKGGKRRRALAIAYRDYKPNRPTGAVTVVLVHGASEAGACWEPYLAPYLAGVRGLRVLVVDLLGHGASEGRARGAHISDYVQSIRAVVLSAGVAEGDLILVGHSMGGISVQRYAELYPVAGLCCYCTTLPERFMALMMHLPAILHGLPSPRPDGRRRRFKLSYPSDVQAFFIDNADVLGGTAATPEQLAEIVAAQVPESHHLTGDFLRFILRPRKPRRIKTDHLLWIAGVGRTRPDGRDDGTGDRAYPRETLGCAAAYKRRQPGLHITQAALVGPHMLMLYGEDRMASADHIYALAEQAVGGYTITDAMVDEARAASDAVPVASATSPGRANFDGDDAATTPTI